MRDFNFFSPYIEVKKTSKKRSLTAISAALLLILSIGFTYMYYLYTTKALEKDILHLETFINSQDSVKKLEQTKEIKTQLEMEHQYYSIVEKIHSQIHEEDRINSKLMEDIASALPTNMFMTELQATGENIELRGVAETRRSIAELEHNLKQLQQITKVHVDMIEDESEETDYYNFHIQCSLR